MLKVQEKNSSFDKKLTKAARVAIIRTSYHQDLNDNLEKHCRQTLLAAGVQEKNIQTFIAPGSWEIPLMAQAAAESKKFDAIVAFGIIVKGETYHFEMIANEAARALMQISLDYGLPVALEVLAVYDKKQAVMRASDDDKNKGTEAAVAVLKSLETLAQIKK
jgi:6,7-dimethyl-8-ribityllumazine synthase